MLNIEEKKQAIKLKQWITMAHRRGFSWQNPEAYRTLLAISKTHGMFARPEIRALQLAALDLPYQPVAVILGAGPGTVSLALLTARPDIIVYSVDITDAVIERAHIERLDLTERFTQICGTSFETGKHWRGPQLDLLFVDACHTYPSVKSDNQVWLPWLKPGGIAWYHDYGTSNGMYLDVKRAVDEDMAGHRQIARANASIAFNWKTP